MKSIKSKGIVKPKSVKVVKKKKSPVKTIVKDSELAKGLRNHSKMAQQDELKEHSGNHAYNSLLLAICLEKPDLYALGYNFRYGEALIYKKITRTFFSVNDAHVCMQVEKKEKTTFVIPVVICPSDKYSSKAHHALINEKRLEEFGVITIRPKSVEQMEYMLSEIT